MKPDDDAMLQAVMARARTIPLKDVQAELDAAMADPLLQDLVDDALAAEDLTPEQSEDARGALLPYFASDPRVRGMLDAIRSGGGKSHVVEKRGAKAPEAPAARKKRGAR